MNVISVQNLWEKKDDADFLVLDVRENDEVASHPYTQLSNLIHIPMNDVPARLSELPRDKEIVVACKSGGRSARVCEFLDEQDFDVRNLTGGILAWSDLLNQQS